MDIETRWKQQISCVGFAASEKEALCVPFMSTEKKEGYWDEQEELEIILAMRKLLTDEKTQCIFHNAPFDLQYFARQWGFVPRTKYDTMLMQHIAFLGMPKSLAFCASMYCDQYIYWKEDNVEYDEKYPQEEHWIYNCTDCVRTFEVFLALKKALEAYGLEEQYAFKQSLLYPALKMMLRGIRTDVKQLGVLEKELKKAEKERNEWFKKVLGHSLNPRSTPQMRDLFYYDFKVKKIFDKKTRKPTLDNDALFTISLKYPLLKPLIEKIQEAVNSCL